MKTTTNHVDQRNGVWNVPLAKDHPFAFSQHYAAIPLISTVTNRSIWMDLSFAIESVVKLNFRFWFRENHIIQTHQLHCRKMKRKLHSVNQSEYPAKPGASFSSNRRNSKRKPAKSWMGINWSEASKKAVLSLGLRRLPATMPIWLHACSLIPRCFLSLVLVVVEVDKFIEFLKNFLLKIS